MHKNYLSTSALCFNSQDLVERGEAIKFKLPQLGEYITGFAIRFNGLVYAYVNQCAHVSVELDWEEGQFFNLSQQALICATHGAMYLPESGLCFAGPCKGKSLKALVVTELDGKIYIDTTA